MHDIQSSDQRSELNKNIFERKKKDLKETFYVNKNTNKKGLCFFLSGKEEKEIKILNLNCWL